MATYQSDQFCATGGGASFVSRSNSGHFLSFTNADGVERVRFGLLNGTAAGVHLYTMTASDPLYLGIAGVARWAIDINANLAPQEDYARDLGSPGARIRNLYAMVGYFAGQNLELASYGSHVAIQSYSSKQLILNPLGNYVNFGSHALPFIDAGASLGSTSNRWLEVHAVTLKSKEATVSQSDGTGGVVRIGTNQANGMSATPYTPRVDFLGYLDAVRGRIAVYERSGNTNRSAMQFVVSDTANSTQSAMYLEEPDVNGHTYVQVRGLAPEGGSIFRTLRFGAQNSGPGGVGRAIYVDN